jgi:hypothetical protein
MKNPITFLGLLLSLLLLTNCGKKEKASCTDGLKNQDEIFSDCGGVCAPCETCYDGILNQNETAIDCGGVCAKCGTCSDGIQNQGETGIDCGGPCTPCTTTTTPPVDDKITYSESGTYGYNLLHDDTVHFVKAMNAGQTVYYTLRSQVPEGMTLKVILTKQTAEGLWWYIPPTSHWSVTPFANNIQQFSTIGKVTTDVQLNFSDKGAVLIQIYENGATTSTREKFIVWY